MQLLAAFSTKALARLHLALLVGVRLLLRLALPSLVPPEWVLLMVVGLLFLWGFSSRYPSVDPGEITP